MTKEELKNEFIKLYNSMSKRKKRRLDIEADGSIYIIDYAGVKAPELVDAFDDLDENGQNEILETIEDLYYNEFE